jgi:thioredoxin reductase (NADPH)
MKIYDVAVIGGGSAGTMAALRVVLNNDECLFFPGTPKDKKKSRAFWVSKIDNMPAHFNYKKGIEEPNKETLEWITKSPFASKLNWMKNHGVTKIERDANGIFVITDNKNQIHHASHVILCTGVMDVQPTINGSIEEIFPYANIQLADYCLRCDGHHVLGKNLAIIGHTTSAAWVGIMLHERYQCPSITILTNGEKTTFDEESIALMNRYGFKIVNEKITAVNGNPKANILESIACEEKTIPVDICFVALGMIVYNQLALDLGADVDQRGFVISDAKGKTSIPNLYVAGDLRANVKKQIYTAWDTAVDSADDINVLIRRKKRIAT